MTASICLNMIVRNEAKAIRRCLDSVMPFIDRWVIVDTGSTDGTQKIITEHLRHIPGRLFERPWKDFGHNRSEAIQLAAGQGDYLLFIDADDFLAVPPDFTMPELTDGAYHVTIEDNSLVYWRKAIVSQSLAWRYVGVLHEYVHCDAAHTTSNLLGPRIVRNLGGSGLSKAAAIEKYRQHARIFEEALRQEPDNSRYVFYLAQSYSDSGQLQIGLQTYQRRAAMGGWEEEVWCAKFQMAKLSDQLGLDIDLVIKRYLEAYEYRPTRAESLVELARFCREKSRFQLAELFAGHAAKIALTPDILFVDRSAYAWRALDELSVAKYWTGDYINSAEICRALLASPGLPENHRSRIAANLKFSEDKLSATE